MDPEGRLRGVLTSTGAGWVLLLRGITALALYLAVRSEAVEGADYRFLAFFVSFISISQTIDFGLGGALTQLATRLPKGGDSLRAIRPLVEQASSVFGGVSAAIVTGLLLALPSSAIGLSGESHYITATTLGLSTGLNVRSTGFDRTLIGLGYYRLAMTASASVAALSAAIICGIAWRVPIYPSLCIAMAGSALLRQLVMHSCVRHVARTSATEDNGFVRKNLTFRELGHNTAIFFGLQLIFFMSFQSDILIANAFGGAATTRSYATSLRFFVNVPGVVAVLCLPLWRSFATSVMQGDAKAAWRKFRRAEEVLLLSSGAAATAIALVLLARPQTFIGGAFSPATAVVWIGWSAVLSWGLIMAHLLASLSLLRYQLALSAAMMVVNVAASIWATTVFGAVGPALGTLVSYTLIFAIPARIRARRMCVVIQD